MCSATLNLGVNGIGNDGSKAIADALKTNSTLTKIYLHGNGIGDDGALDKAFSTQFA